MNLNDINEIPDISLDDVPAKGTGEHIQVKSLSHTHDMVINWMITNPEKALRECADYFGYSQAWLSTLIHTDLFQAKLKERQEQVFSHIASSVPEKLNALADVVTEKLTTTLQRTEDPKFVLDAFDKIMHRAGYAPASQKNPGGQTPQTQVNVFTVSRETLANARQGMFSVGQTVDVTPQVLDVHNPDNAVTVGTKDATGHAPEL
ncbi:hypothetical protein [Methylocaldum sp.]|uniref:hypothetical protein n=1 Tax=Methylocaldum sp. TaxID=1969727 RepID=UPI002D617C51|nr:hypothetical protein [Methylocaldum sp.]HYE38143.1 hypothetical protein [Methylocaldum sp.]